MYILNGHLVLFHCYFIDLFDGFSLIWTCLLFQRNVATKCVQSLFTQKTKVNGIRGDTYSLSDGQNVSVKLQYSVSVAYSTSLFAVAQSLSKKKGTENVTTTKKGNVISGWVNYLPKLLVYIDSFTYIKHTLLLCGASSDPGFRECKLACLCTSSTVWCLQPAL